MRIAVIGGGMAGMEFIRHAYKLPVELTLIEPKPVMVCQALLPELLSDKVDEDSLCVDIEEFCSKVGVEFVRDRAKYIENGLVITEKGEQVEYDAVVVAVGAETNYYGIEGAERTHNVNTLESTLKTKRALNKAEDVIVVGSGITGVEVALELAELGFDVCVVEYMDRVLPTFSPKVSNFVYNIMKKDGIDVKTSNAVLKVEKDGVVTNKGKIFGDVVVWCAGLKPSKFVEYLDVPKEKGWIKVDEFLRAGRVFAIGDCAFVEVDGKVATKTALEAEVQAKHVAENIKRMLKGEEPARYRIRSSIDKPIAMIMLAKNRAILVYKGRALFRPMRLIYKIKKLAIERFLRSFA